MLSTLGNNLHEVESPAGEKILVNMPMKFRRNVWIKKGTKLAHLLLKYGLAVHITP